MPIKSLSTPPWFESPQCIYKQKHAIVLGGGITGVTTAWALARRGWKIDLIEQHETIAPEASGNPLAVLMPRVSSKESTESLFYKAAFYEAIKILTHLKKEEADFSWQQHGVLQLATNKRILKQIEHLNYGDEFVQAVSEKEASKIAGMPINETALYFPMAGWLNPRDLCERLLKHADRRIRRHYNTRITRLYFQNKHWELSGHKAHTGLTSEVLILANASHANKFLQTNWLSLEAARGQISIRTSTKMSKKIRCAICYEGYVLPEANGTHVIGATFSRGDQSTKLKASDDRKNLRLLKRRLPEIFDVNENESTEFKGRAALRAVTPDRMPLVGPAPDLDYFKTHYHDLHKGKAPSTYPKAKYLDGLYLNTGHGTKGLCSSFLSSEIIACQLNNDVLPISRTIQNTLNPSRFIIRDFKKTPFQT